jgi:hypothetical protein
MNFMVAQTGFHQGTRVPIPFDFRAASSSRESRQARRLGTTRRSFGVTHQYGCAPLGVQHLGGDRRRDALALDQRGDDVPDTDEVTRIEVFEGVSSG